MVRHHGRLQVHRTVGQRADNPEAEASARLRCGLPGWRLTVFEVAGAAIVAEG